MGRSIRCASSASPRRKRPTRRRSSRSRFASTDGFGQNRAAESASLNAQYGLDIGPRDHLRLLATAYGARAQLPGVVRQDDVDAGRIGYYDSYPYFAQRPIGAIGAASSSARTSITSPRRGARFDFEPWFMWTDFRRRARTSRVTSRAPKMNPALYGLGDLFETTNTETRRRRDVRGSTARRYASDAPWLVVAEPGVYLRVGHTDQTKSLLDPDDLTVWDRRIDAGLDTLDAAGYVDLDVRLFDRLRISGGVRADYLAMSIDDHIAGATRGRRRRGGRTARDRGIRRDARALGLGVVRRRLSVARRRAPRRRCAAVLARAFRRGRAPGARFERSGSRRASPCSTRSSTTSSSSRPRQAGSRPRVRARGVASSDRSSRSRGRGCSCQPRSP